MNRNTDGFIKESVAIHGFTYDYSKSMYKSSKIKIIIICKTHGAFFKKVHKNPR